MYARFTKTVAACLTGCMVLSMNTGLAFADETTKETKVVSEANNDNNAQESIELAGAGISVLLNKYYEQSKNPKAEILALLTPVVATKKKTPKNTQEVKRKEYFGKIAIAVVDNYVNVRKKPNTESGIVGKIYGHCGATILEEKDGWYKIKSGNVKGYIKADFFVTGEEAESYALKMGYILATVNVPGLNLRKGQGKKSKKLTVLAEGSNYAVAKYGDGWARLAVDEETEGWVKMDYINISADLETAVTLKEEKEQIKKEQEEAERKAREAEADQAANQPDNDVTQTPTSTQQNTWSNTTPTQRPTTTQPTKSETNNNSGSTTGQAVVSYARQFLGNPYVYGGSSLTRGTDCSGFTMSVYAHFGYYLNRSSSSQYSNGRSVSLSALLPGDLIFYAPGGGISHVAIYIGGGQIIHASSPSTGIIITSMYYGGSPCGARRVIN